MAKLDLKKYQTANSDRPVVKTLIMPDGTEGEIWIKPMPAADAAAFTTALYAGSVSKLSDALAWQVSSSIVDEDGNPELTAEDVQSLEHDVFLQIANAIHQVNNPKDDLKKE